MAKRLTAILCVIISLLMIMSSAFAENWFCPDCGKSNEGNFCYNCGSKKPDQVSSKSGITNVQCKYQSDGDVLVTWDDPSKSPPYTVSYEGSKNSNEMDPVNNRKQFLEFLIPGEKYTVTVSNGKGSGSVEYTVPAGVFTEFKSSSKKIVLDDTTFSISAVEKDKTKQFELILYYPQLKNDRKYKGKLVTKTPEGYGGYVYVWADLDLETRYSGIRVNFSMKEFFEGIEESFDEIPRGKYEFEMYLDGDLYSTVQFKVVY